MELPGAQRAHNDPFVGRALETAQLESVLADACAGVGHVVALQGEPGSGKTRLAREATRRLPKETDLLVARGEVLRDEPAHRGAVPLWVFRAPLRRIADRCRVEGTADAVFGEDGPVLLPEGTSEEERAEIVAHTLLGREGRPRDVARTVVFLATGPTYLTGAMIPVDGGRALY